jgi:Skp family chaperone for outer membrane proteins
MFSKDLFETEFTVEKQAEFKRLIETKNKQNEEKAVNLVVNAISKVSQEKCVPYKLAFNQVLQWVHAYA